MSTAKRIFLEDGYYHIFNRGNRKQAIFLEDKDYERFLLKLKKYKEKYNVKILTYGLMPNHIHLDIKTTPSSNVSKLLSDLCNSQSKYFNTKYNTVGALFQGRFKSKHIMTEEYFLQVSRYIHLNPLSLFKAKERTLKNLVQYKWSSLGCYADGKEDGLVDKDEILSYFPGKNPRMKYLKFVEYGIKDFKRLKKLFDDDL